MAENSASQTPLILICNDDGIGAKGIQTLVDALEGIGDRYVIAPLHEQSAVGHAISVRNPIRAKKWTFTTKNGTVPAYAITGTPADCIKIAVSQLLPRPPDIVVSGINQGPNSAVNVIYSGTVSAATEGAILGIDAIAFSLCAWQGGAWETAAHYARRITAKVLQEGLPEGIALNVNIPSVPLADIQGVDVTRQARSRWVESYAERTDPFSQPYYWISGRFVNLEEGEHTDLAALEANYVSITPIKHDLTDYQFVSALQQWGWESND